jgi:biopolymer transport protein ExbD
MAMQSSSEEEEIVAGINVTPLVDVCLVLVIIFMVTAPMMSDPVIKINLPKTHTREGSEADKITLTLGADGRIALDEVIYKSAPEMQEALKFKLSQSDSKLVILRADENAMHGKLTELMAAAKDAGAQSLTIATERQR